MSIETEPKLSKEEKKARKEEKRKRKEAKAAKAAAKASAATSAVPSVITSAVSTVESSPGPNVKVNEVEAEQQKKEKKEKKRKLEREVADGGEGKVKKSKKDSKSTALSDEVSASAAPTTSEAPNGLSKKQLKKLAKASQAASSSASTSASSPAPAPTPSSSLAAPQLKAGKWTSEDREYFKTNGINFASSQSPLPEYSPITHIPSLPVDAGIKEWMKRYTTPTPIQAATWPALLGGQHVVGIAETGSGKTLAFGVPGMQLLVSTAGATGESKKKGRGGQTQMLVIAPTRELALQSHETLEALGEGMGVGSVCIYGGAPKDPQIAAIRKKETKIVVGTPGRVLDLADSGDLDLSKVAYLVLDEADRMLDQGFENDIRRIFAHCPGKEERQTVMFSATWPESVRRLAQTFLNSPLQITIGSDELSANKRIEQIVEVLDDGRQKDGRMLHHLRSHLKAHPSAAAPTRILVFALYKKEAQRIESTLSRQFSVAGLHGDLSQDARFKALDKFKKGEVNVLVATDVAARGLDIPDVGLVLNVTFPLTTEDFVHRCGRTGRAGKSGRAVTFFTGENHERSLAGEFVRVLRDAGAEVPKEMDRFPLTVKKKEHGAYGAFYKDISNAPAPTKITFD